MDSSGKLPRPPASLPARYNLSQDPQSLGFLMGTCSCSSRHAGPSRQVLGEPRGPHLSAEQGLWEEGRTPRSEAPRVPPVNVTRLLGSHVLRG